MSFPVAGDQGVPPNSPLQFLFDQPMDTQNAGVLSIEPAAEGSGQWIAPDTFVFRPTQWSVDTLFSVSLERFRSAHGVPLAGPAQLTFATYSDGRVPLPILMYHRLVTLPADASAATKEWATAPETFTAHLAYLHEHGYQPVTLKAALAYLEQDAPLPFRPLCITFDDGYADFLSLAWPALHQHEYPATVFIIPSHVGYGAFMDWAEISEMAASGIAIGSHTLDHVSLRGLDPEELRRQLQDSKEMLEKNVGQPVTLLSYAYGGYDDAAVDAARSAGYVLGLTINPSPYQVRGRPFQLNRVHAPYQATLDDFARLLP
jgi:peptidoglycan/xylan/chitin deacetylase (PgdA/CDA1 family)